MKATVTLLFTDMEGSTEHARSLGDAAFAEVLDDYRRLIREAATKQGGLELDAVGDGLAFALDSATGAARAASNMLVAAAAHPWPGDTVRVRVGLHTGEPEHVDGRLVGVDVHRAERVCSAAHGGQAVVTGVTRALLDSEFELAGVGTYRLKGLDRSEQLYQLVVPGLERRFPPLRSVRVTGLPTPSTPLVGRKDELQRIASLVLEERTPLLTLTGPGGVGKTRLALEVAAQLADSFTGGTFFVDLTGVVEHGPILGAVAAALTEQSARRQPPWEVLRELSIDGPLLIVLDGFERIVDRAVELKQLLSARPEATVLVTSRVRLGLAEEHVLSVPPLTLPDANESPAAIARAEAVALFLERLDPDRRASLARSAELAVVARICRSVDGLPLGIELAAARARMLSPADILARLDSGTALARGRRDAPPRHESLESAIEWSYELLSEASRQLLRRLAIFPGSFSLGAAEAICEATVDELESLCEHNLLNVDPNGSPDSRFSLFDTVRQFASLRLRGTLESGALEERHMDYFTELAIAAGPELRGPQQLEWRKRLEADEHNLRVALAQALRTDDAHRAVRLSAALSPFWYLTGRLPEGRSLLEQALALHASPALPLPLHAHGLAAAGWLALEQGDHEAAVPFLEQALALYRRTNELAGVLDTLNNLGSVAVMRGEPGRARRRYEEALAVAEEVGDDHAVAFCENNIGFVMLGLGELEPARAAFEKSLALVRSIGDHDREAASLVNIARADLAEGDLAASGERLKSAAAILRSLESRTADVVEYLQTAATLCLRVGDLERAAVLSAASERVRADLGLLETPLDRRARDDLLQGLSTRLAPDVLARCLADGRELSEVQAFAETATALVQSRPYF